MAKSQQIANLQIFAWSLSGLVTALAIFVWGQEMEWEFDKFSAYSFFPVLGLVAFSLMWCHYIISVARQYLGVDKKYLKTYIEVTGWIVLALILLHPGLLEWQLLRDGFGWPPGSVLDNYVAPSLKLFAVFGMVGLLLLLAYELRRWYEDRSWWKYVGYAVDFGMILIFLHSINLGESLEEGWFRYVWIFYGLTLIAAMGYSYYRRFTKPKTKPLSS